MQELRQGGETAAGGRGWGAPLLPVFTESVVIHALGLHVRVQVLFFFHWCGKKMHSRRGEWVTAEKTSSSSSSTSSPVFAPERMTADPL